MAEYICVFNKDTLIIKPSKKSPLFLRTIVLLFAMVCGVYICTICRKQISTVTKMNIQVIGRPSPDTNIAAQLEPQIPTLHYPKPETFSRGECTQNLVRFFVILSIQRSGSGWFETLLNSHVNVSSNGEIFSVMERRKNISTIIQTLEKVYNLDWLNSASKNECSAAVGFKWMLNQGLMVHHEEIVEYFKQRGVAAIFLFRRNLLRRMVSVLANSYDRHAKLLNGTHKSHVHSHQEKLKDVQEFLGIPEMELISHQVKIHEGPLSGFVKNWDDVNRTLSGTERTFTLFDGRPEQRHGASNFNMLYSQSPPAAAAPPPRAVVGEGPNPAHQTILGTNPSQGSGHSLQN
ncbi:P-loop containing nucleoside triphosphate hydrolases superfamily protein isoform 4 [Hibiscus syriacus]|uniref:P-loop containing nucleoside triphosphate hydrolases superfamily protein isoform 4 n=1 Tax=Hibiscus syriacus TaxID=106335 RepID=A0A6A3BGE2_HIBSY|nr:P-loop containing nucleoside triphosphate hydrolases superfamily protein isoform 4 [Hibiscus syriacus]